MREPGLRSPGCKTLKWKRFSNCVAGSGNNAHPIWWGNSSGYTLQSEKPECSANTSHGPFLMKDRGEKLRSVITSKRMGEPTPYWLPADWCPQKGQTKRSHHLPAGYECHHHTEKGGRNRSAAQCSQASIWRTWTALRRCPHWASRSSGFSLHLWLHDFSSCLYSSTTSGA